MKRRIMLGMAFAVMLSIFNLAGNALATIWYADNNAPAGGDGLSWGTAFNTVQGCLNAAVSGDELWVKQGTYVENITMKDGVALYGGFAGTEVDRLQRDWNAFATVLDGNQLGSVVVILSCPSTLTRLDGFVIRNGSGTNWGNRLGGGILSQSSSPTIANNKITGNAADIGGGIAFLYDHATIRNNDISGNTANIYGGGIYLSNSSSAVVSNFMNNNISGDYGGAISTNQSSAVIANNLMYGNSVPYLSGGAIELAYSNDYVNNNTIVGNTAFSGGAIYFFMGYSPVVKNNIVVHNSSGLVADTYSFPVLGNNDVYGNTEYDYAGVVAGTGDISAAPGFFNELGGDYHLVTTSPCIDSGDNSVVQSNSEDVAGAPRVLKGTPIAPSAIVDIGAYEYDIWPPSIASTDPLSGADNVSRSNPVVIYFSENIRRSSAFDRITIKKGKHIIPITFKTTDGNILTLHHDLLSRSNIYVVTIPALAIEDKSGNPLDTSYSFAFTTGTE